MKRFSLTIRLLYLLLRPLTGNYSSFYLNLPPSPFVIPLSDPTPLLHLPISLPWFRLTRHAPHFFIVSPSAAIIVSFPWIPSYPFASVCPPAVIRVTFQQSRLSRYTEGGIALRTQRSECMLIQMERRALINVQSIIWMCSFVQPFHCKCMSWGRKTSQREAKFKVHLITWQTSGTE